MTLTDPVQKDPLEDAAQALFEEARRRRRHRWRIGAAIVFLAGAAVSTGVFVVGRPAHHVRPHVGPATGGPAPQVNRVHERSAWLTSAWKTPGVLNGAACNADSCVAVGFSGASSGGSLFVNPKGAVGRALISSDGGRIWSVGDLPPGTGALESVSCVTSSQCVAVGYAGSSGPADIGAALYSTNGGTSWQDAVLPAGTLPLESVSCPSPSRCVAVGNRASLSSAGELAVYSTDSGKTWTTAQLPTGVTGISAVSCASGTTACMATAQESTPAIIVSADGGTTWSTATTPSTSNPFSHLPTTVNFDSVFCSTTEHCVVAGDFDGGRVSEAFVTDDAGTSWLGASGWSLGGMVGSPDAIWCGADGHCLAFANDDPHPFGAELSSADGGLDWKVVSSGLPGDPMAHVGALTCSSDLSCVSVGMNSALTWMSAAWTTNGGSAWAASVLPVPLGSVMAVACWRAKTCLAVGKSATVAGLALSTTDGGARWSALSLPPGTPALDAVSCPAARRCVAVGSVFGTSHSEAIYTDNAGRSWASTPFPGGTSFSTLICTSLRACWTGGSSGGLSGGGFIAFSKDMGRSWARSRIPKKLLGIAALTCHGPTSCLAVASEETVGSPVLRLVAGPAPGRWGKVGKIGRLWALPPYGTSKPDVLRCQDASHCLLATAAQLGPAPTWRGRILATSNGGRTWRVAGRSPDEYQSLAGIACPASDECIGVGSGPPNEGAGIVSTLGNGTRESVEAMPRGVGNLYGIRCPNTKRCITVGASVGSAAILVTNDGGRTWTPSSLPTWVMQSSAAAD